MHCGEVNVQTILSFIFFLTVIAGVVEEVGKVDRLNMIEKMVLSVIRLVTHCALKNNLSVLRLF